MNPKPPFAVLASLSAALALFGAGCGDDESTSGSSSGPPGPPSLSGVLSYERVPYNHAAQGLDYGAIARHPIRGARVQLLSAADDGVIAETVSGDDGAYSFALPAEGRYKLWIFSETVEPPITVEDNTAGNAIYVLQSAEVDSTATRELPVVAVTGWGGSGYTAPREAAVFAILDTTYGAARRFMTEVTPPPTFPPLRINWSENNSTVDGNVNQGQIGTSFWDGSALYILGKDGDDTDEFDDHVIVHEWGHYMESKLGRADSPGGSHGYGDILDPRVAMSEGWGTALSAMILDPDTVYADSYGPGQAEGYAVDIEFNDTSPDAVPGWFSETTSESLLLDLYDGKNEPFDQVEVGLQGIYEALSGSFKSTPSVTTLFAFVDAMKSQRLADAQAIDAVCTENTLDASFGMSPVADAWGAGETHDAGLTGVLPLYVDGALGGTYPLTLTGGYDYNTLAANRFIRFTGQGGPVTVTSTSASDVDLYVYRDGIEVASAATLSGDEQVTFNAVNGTTYIINVEGYEVAAGNYAASIDINP